MRVRLFALETLERNGGKKVIKDLDFIKNNIKDDKKLKEKEKALLEERILKVIQEIKKKGD